MIHPQWWKDNSKTRGNATLTCCKRFVQRGSGSSGTHEETSGGPSCLNTLHLRSTLLKLQCVPESPLDLLKWRLWFSRSGAGPEVLHV